MGRTAGATKAARVKKAENVHELSILIRKHGTAKGQRWYAKRLGVSQQTISKYIKELEKQWRAENVENVEVLKRAELRKLDLIESELWDAWDRSVGTFAEVTIEMRGKDEGEKTRTRTHDQVGSAAIMAQIIKTHERRSLLMGLDAPGQFEGNVTHGVTSDIKAEARRRLRARVHRLALERAKDIEVDDAVVVKEPEEPKGGDAGAGNGSKGNGQ